MTIRAFIFDMDGLIFDSETLAIRLWQKAAREFGKTLERKFFDSLIGKNARDVRLVFQHTFGEEFPYTKIRERYKDLQKKAIENNELSLKPGVHRLLDTLDSLGIPAAVGTSSDTETASFKLQKAELLSRFRGISGGDRVKRGKPAPDIFLAAGKLLGTPPHTCLVLEDSESGIKAAFAAGMRPVLVPDLITPTREMREMSYAVYESLDEVADNIDKLLK